MGFDLGESMAVLRRTPGALGAMLGGLSDAWTMRNYGPETFSPFDVVGHLICAERDNWMVRLRMILDQGEGTPFPPFDRYAMWRENVGKTMAELLETFAQMRQKNLRDLEALRLTEDMLDRRGTHPEFGTVTARQLIATWVVHDLGHTHQIAKAMAYQYRDEVGPWRAYLTILPRS